MELEKQMIGSIEHIRHKEVYCEYLIQAQRATRLSSCSIILSSTQYSLEGLQLGQYISVVNFSKLENSRCPQGGAPA